MRHAHTSTLQSPVLRAWFGLGSRSTRPRGSAVGGSWLVPRGPVGPPHGVTLKRTSRQGHLSRGTNVSYTGRKEPAAQVASRAAVAAPVTLRSRLNAAPCAGPHSRRGVRHPLAATMFKNTFQSGFLSILCARARPSTRHELASAPSRARAAASLQSRVLRATPDLPELRKRRSSLAGPRRAGQAGHSAQAARNSRHSGEGGGDAAPSAPVLRTMLSVSPLPPRVAGTPSARSRCRSGTRR